jgi:hypothetical protein
MGSLARIVIVRPSGAGSLNEIPADVSRFRPTATAGAESEAALATAQEAMKAIAAIVFVRIVHILIAACY